jgi:PAS domain-containing protein
MVRIAAKAFWLFLPTLTNIFIRGKPSEGFESLGEPVVLDVFDLMTGRHTYFSSDTLTLYGYTREEMVQMADTFAVLVHPDDIPRLRANIARLQRLADGEIHEFDGVYLLI